MNAIQRGQYPLLGLFLALTFQSSASRAAEPKNILPGYEFATWMGTGLYEIGGERIWYITAPLDRELREAKVGQLGYRLLLPLTVGWLNTTDLRSDNLQTVTFIPGIELVYRGSERLTLRPFVQTGIGRDLATGNSAWIYGGGVRGRYELALEGENKLIFGGALVGAGSESGGVSSSFGRLDLGMGWERPVDWQIWGREAKVGAYYVLSQFSDSAKFATTFDPDQFNLGTVHELGLSIGVRRPFKLFGLKLEWFGLSVVTGDNLDGVKLNSGFPL